MANNRTPTRKAQVSGATLKNPQRYRTRPVRDLPGLGEAPKWFDDRQRARWKEYRQILPWLRKSDGPMVELACVLAARMDSPEGLGVSGMHALSSILSKLGASPTDESKARRQDAEDEEPEDKFFQTH